MFDFRAFEDAGLRTSPFPWARLEQAFPPPVAIALASQFPEEGFTEKSGGREEGYLRYLLRRTLVDDDRVVTSETPLSPIWADLAGALLAPGYRQAVERLTEISLEGCHLNARLCRYPPGGWIPPHIDRPERVVTQIVYLTRHWKSDWGGALHILRSPDPADIAEEIPPAFNTSVLFVGSDISFHAVASVIDTAETRLSLLLQFIRAS